MAIEAALTKGSRLDIKNQPFDELYIPVTETGCWLWLGNIAGRGYGKLYTPERIYAHRWSYTLHHGAIPEGLVVRHTCDTPLCVNPAHLLAGTAKDNIQDCIRRNRQQITPQEGENNGRAKLTARDIPIIRRDTRTLTKIAAEYGVNFTAIHKVKTSQSWRHIPWG